ncbi:MAG TPA: hypothetical protein VM223_00050 [Planctomycetota bacterium]|nr:hypothetical protein [Planctomycetota bacterium]
MSELLSFDFTKTEKDSLLCVCRKYAGAPPHHYEVTNALLTPGSTVLNEREARYLAGIVRPYYSFLAERIEAHPLLDGQSATATGTVAALREALEGLDGEMRVVLSRDAELTECLPVAGYGICYYSPTAEGAHLTEQPGTIPAQVLWSV